MATAAPVELPADRTTVANNPPTWTPIHQPTVELNNENRPLSFTPNPSPFATVPTNTPVPTPTPTATLTPTPTRYISYIPNLPPSGELGPSKLGLHVLSINSPDIIEFVRQARPAVMKTIGEFGFLAEVKRISPRTLTIGRVDDIFIQNYLGVPEEAAREYVNKHLQTYQLNPAVDYWEGWNEPDPPTLDHMIWYSRFEQERVRVMAQHGLRSAIGGFPPGVPELHEFRFFVPAIEAAIEHRGILTLHEGDLGSGDLTHLYGEPLPGYPAYPDRGSGAFRYRWFYREILEPMDLVIPLVISELDFTSNQVPDLLAQFAWYDNGIRLDGYVIGTTIFTAGANEHIKIWDVNPMLPQLTAYVVSQR